MTSRAHTSQRSRAAWYLGLAMLAVSGAIGCGSSISHIERGQAITTESDPHDEFLKAVLAVHEEAETAPDEEQAARAPLARALGLDPTTGAGAVVLAAGSRAKKLSETGILLHLSIAPQPELIAKRPTAKIAENDEAAMKAIEQAAKTSLTTSRRFATLQERVEELERQRTELSSQPEGRKGDIAKELAGAKVVLDEARQASGNAAGGLARFLINLAGAVETGAATEALAKVAAPPKPPAAKPTKKWGRPAGKWGKPTGKPPAKRPSSDEFEP